MAKSMSKQNSDIQAALMAWYDGNARTLPWRDSRDPYRIWVSEIMLQQTQVKTALPYYERFVEMLPDAKSLAEADEARLLKLWEGLGYYSRVRNMQKAARMIMEEHGGRLPRSYELLLKLPGIGEYSAGAIASIAFGVAVPAVDGNVMRVFSRIFGSMKDIADLAVKKAFREISMSLQPPGRPGDFNQALMELGAVVCLPNGAPHCESCPLAGFCIAFRDGTSGSIPVKTPKAKRKTEKRTILVICAGEKVLLRKRDNKGLLAGMSEPVNLEGWLPESRIDGFLSESGLKKISLKELGKSRHMFTHIVWEMEGYEAQVQDQEAPDGYFWAEAEALEADHAIPSAYKTFIRHQHKHQQKAGR